MTSTEGPLGHPVVAEADRLVGHLVAPAIAVLADGRDRPAAGALRDWRPKARIVRLDVREPSPRLHVQLAAVEVNLVDGRDLCSLVRLRRVTLSVLPTEKPDEA